MSGTKETIDTMVEYLKQAVEVAKPQATALLADYVSFYQLFYAVVAILMVVVFIGFIISYIKYTKHRNSYSDYEFEWANAAIWFGVASFFSIVTALAKFKSVLMCWTAPNLWLIERGLSLS